MKAVLAWLYGKSGTATGNTFEKLCEITSVPALPTPEKLDRSDCGSVQKKSAQGKMPEIGDFGFLYDIETFNALLASADTEYTYQLRFTMDGTNIAWQWTGTHYPAHDGTDANGDIKGKLMMYMDTAMEIVNVQA